VKILHKLVIVLLFCVGLALIAPLAVRAVFFRMPEYSASFDCDDGALLMMERLQGIGITAAPVLGNLKLSGEQYLESDHVWVVIEIAGRWLALDRGVIYTDRQHYEGFLINRQQLLEFVAQDLDQAGQTGGNPAAR
jgi:hypothetical protein